MKNRSMVEVFDIVKKYHYLYNVDGEKFMCRAVDIAYRYGKISEEEMYSLEALIEDEMQGYADCYIPKEDNYRVDVHTSLHSVIVEALKSRHYDTVLVIDRDRFYEMADEIIPSWWDSFYKKLRLMEEYGIDKYYFK